MGGQATSARHRTRLLIAGAAALVVVGGGAALTMNRTAVQAQEQRDSPATGWTELEAPPVSPRTGSTVAWTGAEALFLGGTTGNLCPPTASCITAGTRARDGAAYDPSSGTWRVVAAAPVDLPGYGQAPVVDDQAFVLADGELLAYDASDDAWARLAGPPGPDDDGWSLHQGDGTVVALRYQQRGQYFADQQYDPASRRWRALPKDPLVPSFDRDVVTTPHGLLLTGQPEVDQPGSDLETSLTQAALLVDGAWRRLPGSDQLGGGFTWTGRRAVAPTLGGADGGQVNGYGRTVPFGGTLELPEGRWGRLPDAPAEWSDEFALYAVAGPRVVVQGWLYDDEREAWTKLRRPQGSPEHPGSAVWAGGQLVVFGGYTPDREYSDRGLSASAYTLSPP